MIFLQPFHSEESENDSDLDSQIVQITTNLQLEDEEQKSFQQEAIASSGIFIVKNKSIISSWWHFLAIISLYYDILLRFQLFSLLLRKCSESY